jgi:hypothetical protein
MAHAQAFEGKNTSHGISKRMKRTVGALRQQAIKLGIDLGNQR